jgi:hypothetical protein
MTFEKRWRVANPEGAAPWPVGTVLQQVHGENMGTTRSVALREEIWPGRIADVGLSLRAPLAPGTCVTRWQLSTATGVHFGEVLVCHIIVAAPTFPPAPSPLAPPPVGAAPFQPLSAAYAPKPGSLSSAHNVPLYPMQPLRPSAPPGVADSSADNVALVAAFEEMNRTPRAPHGGSSTQQSQQPSMTASLAHDLAAVASFEAASEDRHYDKEMASLIAMGFANRPRNLDLLRTHRGVLEAVLDALQAESDADWARRR